MVYAREHVNIKCIDKTYYLKGIITTVNFGILIFNISLLLFWRSDPDPYLHDKEN